MNLNTLMETYNQVIQLETRVGGSDNGIVKALREEENLKEELRKINLEFARIDKENRELQEKIARETGKLEEITADIRQSTVTLQTLEELENRHCHLVSETQILEEKSSQLQALFQELADRLVSPGLQARFQRLNDIDAQLKQQVTLQKRIAARKKNNEKKKKNSAHLLEKTHQDIEKIKKNHQQDIDHFLFFQQESPKLEKKKISLTKKNQRLTGKIQGLEKKLQNEASREKFNQHQQELENKKKRLEIQIQTRTGLGTKKKEITQQLNREIQRLDKIKEEIKELETINDELTAFLGEKGIDSQYTGGTVINEETLETIGYLKKYCRETVIPQDNRTGNTTRIDNIPQEVKT